jgi:DNA-binding beta-propeller fold protein YncE
VPRALVPLVLLLLALSPAAAGCGSEDDLGAFPPAAVPARSPVPEAAPEGRVVRVGAGAEGIAVDERTGLVAVAVRDPDELVLLDVASLAVRARVALPGPARHVTVDRPGVLLVPVDGTRTVVEVALPSGRARTLPALWPVHDVVRSGDALLAADSITEVPDGPIARIDARARRLSLLDRGTGRLLEDAPAGVGPAHLAAAADDGRVYVADADGNSVLLFRTRPELALARRYGLPGTPYGTAIDREKGKLWVTLTGRNEVVQLTGDGQPREQRRFATVRGPRSVAIHEPSGRVFVTGAARGELQAFDGYPTRLAGS